MGSSFETTVYRGTDDVDAAYRQLFEQARYEYGSEPYSGTIATSSGYTVHPGGPVSLTAARRIANAAADGLTKWSQWLAVPLGESESKTREVRVVIPAKALAGLDDHQMFRHAQSAAADKAPKGWEVASSRIVSWERTVGAPTASPVPALRNVWVVDGPGAGTCFDAKADAVRYAKELATASVTLSGDNDWHVRAAKVTVTRQSRTADGEPAAITVTVPTKKLVATVELALERAKGTARCGWLFAGWAAT
jgi:hypothetical protein